MYTMYLKAPAISSDFDSAKGAADNLARELLGECACMSWYDRIAGHEAPAHASECHDDTCELPGYVEYAQSRGAELMIDVGDGNFVFCYRSLGDFA